MVQYSHNDIDGDSNTVKVTQRGAHYSKIDINGNSNNIEVTQRGNPNPTMVRFRSRQWAYCRCFSKIQ